MPSLTCDSGTSLYSVRLFDAGGDGWQGATWQIYDPSQTYVLLGGTLASGYSSRVYQCVADGCGWLAVGGGAADSEISWAMDSFTGESFQGVAPLTDYCARAAAAARARDPAESRSPSL